MTEKILSSRITQKHDIEDNWLKATQFIPRVGEFIVYDKDSIHNYSRFKIGDGVTPISVLPFTTDVDSELLNKMLEEVLV